MDDASLSSAKSKNVRVQEQPATLAPPPRPSCPGRVRRLLGALFSQQKGREEAYNKNLPRRGRRGREGGGGEDSRTASRPGSNSLSSYRTGVESIDSPRWLDSAAYAAAVPRPLLHCCQPPQSQCSSSASAFALLRCGVRCAARLAVTFRQGGGRGSARPGSGRRPDRAGRPADCNARTR